MTTIDQQRVLPAAPPCTTWCTDPHDHYPDAAGWTPRRATKRQHQDAMRAPFEILGDKTCHTDRVAAHDYEDGPITLHIERLAFVESIRDDGGIHVEVSDPTITIDVDRPMNVDQVGELAAALQQAYQDTVGDVLTDDQLLESCEHCRTVPGGPFGWCSKLPPMERDGTPEVRS